MTKRWVKEFLPSPPHYISFKIFNRKKNDNAECKKTSRRKFELKAKKNNQTTITGEALCAYFIMWSVWVESIYMQIYETIQTWTIHTQRTCWRRGNSPQETIFVLHNILPRVIYLFFPSYGPATVATMTTTTTMPSGIANRLQHGKQMNLKIGTANTMLRSGVYSATGNVADVATDAGPTEIQ